MRRTQKSKRVSWATDVNLCQVRLFLSDETPSQVAVGNQDNLQAKPWLLPGGGMGSDDNLPPGFEAIQPADPWAAKLSQISLAKWKCPPRFSVNSSWQVVAGEESREIETQNQREMRVLEAIYPRPSAIPLNPSALAGAEGSGENDHFTPVVPVTPIEDEDAPSDTPNTTPRGPFPSRVENDHYTPAENDIISAAQAALSSVIPNSDPANMIDRELLMKILSDRKMIEQLISNHAASSTGQNVIGSESVVPPSLQGVPPIGPKNAPSSSCPPSTSLQFNPNLAPNPNNSFIPVNNNPLNRREIPISAPTGGPFHHPGGPHLRADVISGPNGPTPSVTKDINYYKSLIQQHGGERREAMPQFANQEPLNNTNTMMRPNRDSKARIMKPCIYFNSARGCRNGANCAFQHEAITQQQRVDGVSEVQGSKRVKLDREITGA